MIVELLSKGHITAAEASLSKLEQQETVCPPELELSLPMNMVDHIQSTDLSLLNCMRREWLCVLEKSASSI